MRDTETMIHLSRKVGKSMFLGCIFLMSFHIKFKQVANWAQVKNTIWTIYVLPQTQVILKLEDQKVQ